MLWKFHSLLVSIYLLSMLQGSFTDEDSSKTTDDSTEDTFLEAAKKEYAKYQNDKKQLAMIKKKLKDVKKKDPSTRKTDLIRLNVGGEIMMTTRESLTSVSKSLLTKLFSDRSTEEKMPHDMDMNIFLDFDPTLFRHLLEQLRRLKKSVSFEFTPPRTSSSFDAQAFQRMLKKLGLSSISSSSNEIVMLNVGGSRVLTRQKTLNYSKSSSLMSHSPRTKILIDADPWLFRKLLGRLREQKVLDQLYVHAPSCEINTMMNRMLNNFGLNSTVMSYFPSRWKQDAMTVAGDDEYGNETNQLKNPRGLFIDKNQTIYIADNLNRRIMAWKANDTAGEMVAETFSDRYNSDSEEEGESNEMERLTDVVLDTHTNSLLVCDRESRRVIRWSWGQMSQQGDVLIDDIKCSGLTIDGQGSLYVVDVDKDEVRRYGKNDEKNGVVVAGGHGNGDNLNQLNNPTYLFVDTQFTVYVSDSGNHRVMKWMKGAKEGMIVAGGNEEGESLRELSLPHGVWVDECRGHVYVADLGNNRIMRWEKGAQQGTVIVGGNDRGKQMNQLDHPIDLSFDHRGHLYVVDMSNHRVQRFFAD